MKDRYINCYVSGRMDSFDGNVELASVIDKIRGGASVRDATLEAARQAVTAEMDAETKVQWLNDNLDTIRVMGGDTEKAWRLFCQGRIDALAMQIEETAMEEIVNQLEEEEDDDGDEDEEDEEGDDDEDEDEDDDDDEDEEDDE